MSKKPAPLAQGLKTAIKQGVGMNQEDILKEGRSAGLQKNVTSLKEGLKEGLGQDGGVQDPPFCGDIDMCILRDGTWLYQGSPIGRPALVQLFARVLQKGADSLFYLVTPVEKVRIQVEDVPFIVVSAEKTGDALWLTTNVGDQCVLDENHPLWVLEGDRGEPLPYVRIRDQLDARVNRNTFYHLVDMAQERWIDGRLYLGISSCGHFYPLSPSK